ncbi:MAG: thioredoxin family protein [Kiritimatiellae bacterium]|jgi:thioredoxin 1|nr:thioredoxin family protein [Kiritimatiellia bacterium]
MNRFLILLMLVLSLVAGCSRNNSVAIEHKSLPTLLEFGSVNCIPCKQMAPILDELAEEYKGKFNVKFIDVWLPENREVGMSYNIQTIPTQIFFDSDGKELWRHTGFFSKEDILNKWQELGISL